MFINGKMHLVKIFQMHLEFLTNFMYLLGRRKESALVHVYVWEHIVSFLQNRLMDIYQNW